MGKMALTKQIFRDICFPVNSNWEQSSGMLTRKHNFPACSKKRSHSNWYLGKKTKMKRGRIRGKKATNKKKDTKYTDGRQEGY